MEHWKTRRISKTKNLKTRQRKLENKKLDDQTQNQVCRKEENQKTRKARKARKPKKLRTKKTRELTLTRKTNKKLDQQEKQKTGKLVNKKIGVTRKRANQIRGNSGKLQKKD